MTVREARAQDVDAIREVSALAVETLRRIYRPTKEARQQKASRQRLRSRLVCECNNRIVGTVQYEIQGDRLHILGPLVPPEFRRRGVARLFMDHLGEVARDLGLRALSLNTTKQTGNVTIFSKLGFRPLRETPGDPRMAENLTDEELVDVYMERQLSQPSAAADARGPRAAEP